MTTDGALTWVEIRRCDAMTTAKERKFRTLLNIHYTSISRWWSEDLRILWIYLILTLLNPSTTSVSTIDFTLPLELLLLPSLLLPWIIKLVCLINFRAFGERRERSERVTVGCCDAVSPANPPPLDKWDSGQILWMSLIPSLTVDRFCARSSTTCSLEDTFMCKRV